MPCRGNQGDVLRVFIEGVCVRKMNTPLLLPMSPTLGPAMKEKVNLMAGFLWIDCLTKKNVSTGIA